MGDCLDLLEKFWFMTDKSGMQEIVSLFLERKALMIERAVALETLRRIDEGVARVDATIEILADTQRTGGFRKLSKGKGTGSKRSETSPSPEQTVKKRRRNITSKFRTSRRVPKK